MRVQGEEKKHMNPIIFRGSRGVGRNQQFPLLSLFDEVNRLFDEASTPTSGEIGRSQFVPKLDLKETSTEYVVTGEFPGLAVEDVQIELQDNTLTMSGEKRYEYEHKEGERVYKERSYGSFRRSIPFEVEVDEDNATAEMKNGVLTVKIPKSAKVVRGAKKLSIKAAS